MSGEIDTNTLAFNRLKEIVKVDATLPEDVRNAIVLDNDPNSTVISRLKTIFEDANAITK